MRVALRDKKGRFTSSQADAANLFYNLARELQRAQVNAFRESRKRPGIATGKLERALMDERNIVVDRFGFAVGNEDWLDSSDALYWRAIDQGTSAHVGRTIKGIWGESNRGGVPGPDWSPFGPPAGDIFRPMGQKYAYHVLRSAGYGSKDSKRTKGVIEKPIEAQEFMRRGWKKFNPSRSASQLMKKWYGDQFVEPKRGPRRPPKAPS